MLTKIQLHFLFWLAVVVWAGMLFLSGDPINVALLKPAHHVLLVLSLFLAAYEKWAWRWRIFHWMIKRPNLNGNYKGTLVSSYIDPQTNQKIPPIPAYISIHQTLLTIQIRQYTKESDSTSVVGDFVHSFDGRYELIFTYHNEPRTSVRDRSEIHYGTAKLLIQGNTERLTGSYWTDRKTTGEMTFEHTNRCHCHSFNDCEKQKKKPTKKKRLF